MANRRREADIRDKMVAELKPHCHTAPEYHIRVNRKCNVRRAIDIVCQDKESGEVKVIEIKQASRYAHAIGQLLSYQALMHHTNPTLVLVIYGTPYELLTYEGECRKVLDNIREKYGIIISLLTEVG